MSSASTRRRIALAAGILPLVLAAAIVLASRDPAAGGTVAAPLASESTADAAAPDAVISAADVEAASPGDAAAAAARTTPRAFDYPPPDIAVAEVIAQLDARARAGDAQAACRIAAELQRCRQLQGWSERTTDYQIERLAKQSLDEATLDARSRDLAEANAYNAQAKRHCEGVTLTQLRRAPHYLLAAARAGHVPSMVAFASGGQTDAAALVSDPQLYADYRAHAWPMFQRAFELGEPSAALFWSMLGTQGAYLPLTALVPDDWPSRNVALALSLRLQQELAPDEPMPRPDQIGIRLNDADFAVADALYARHFADSPRMAKWRSLAAEQKPRDPDRAHRFEAQTGRCEDELG